MLKGYLRIKKSHKFKFLKITTVILVLLHFNIYIFILLISAFILFNIVYDLQFLRYMHFRRFLYASCNISEENQMKQEQIQPKGNSVLKKTSQKEQEPKLERVHNEPALNPMIDPSRVREENQPVFHAAHGQRKAMNIEKMKQYMTKRVESFQERVRVCDTIRAMFFEKQKNTKIFLKNLIRYFEDYVEIYTSLYKSINKLELKKKYENSTMYTAIKQSVAQLVKLNEEESDHVQKFVDWLQKILVEAVKSSYTYFKERIKKINKDLETSDYNYFNSWSKEQKAYEKLPEGKDLLQKQLILMEHIKNTNETAITRSVDLYQAWQYLIEEENTIKRLLKDNILQFHDRFVKFHKKTESANAIFKYWSNLPPSANVLTVFASFLDEKSVAYITFGAKSKKLSDSFEGFMRMVYEQQRIGNPHPYLDILIAKKFSSKLQQSQRQWKDVKLLFSVDSNLLIMDEKEGKVILKLLENSVKLKRVSENILELSGVEQGVIFNSNKKQMIHFQTLDQVEQFIYFVNSIPEKKEGQK